ncbi:MAG: hypothetical protein AAGH99_12440 [Planctomycetota bacterium]
MRILFLLLIACVCVSNLDNSASAETQHDHGVSPEKREDFLSRRMSGKMIGRFSNFGSLLYAVDDIVIHTDDEKIAATRLFSPFPDSYRPTRREFFDAMARCTDSTWAYDDERDYWLFSPAELKPAYRLTLADGWLQQPPRYGGTSFQAPPEVMAGMDIGHVGTYSASTKQLRDEQKLIKFWGNLRRDLALKFTTRFPGTISDQDLIPVEIAGHKAVYCVTTLNDETEIVWHQWVFIADGQGFLITCGSDPANGTGVPEDVSQMLNSLKIPPSDKP